MCVLLEEPYLSRWQEYKRTHNYWQSSEFYYDLANRQEQAARQAQRWMANVRAELTRPPTLKERLAAIDWHDAHFFWLVA